MFKISPSALTPHNGHSAKKTQPSIYITMYTKPLLYALVMFVINRPKSKTIFP
jgi:hypothetical protein